MLKSEHLFICCRILPELFVRFLIIVLCVVLFSVSEVQLLYLAWYFASNKLVFRCAAVLLIISNRLIHFIIYTNFNTTVTYTRFYINMFRLSTASHNLWEAVHSRQKGSYRGTEAQPNPPPHQRSWQPLRKIPKIGATPRENRKQIQTKYKWTG